MTIADVAVAWSRVAARTIGIAKKIGLRLVSFGDKFPYLRALLETLHQSSDWDRVLLQLPPGPSIAGMSLAKNVIHDFRLVCDVHTGMIIYRDAKQVLLNAPFIQLLHGCDYALAHNSLNSEYLRAIGLKNVLTVYDPIPEPVPGRAPDLNIEVGNYLLVPAGWDTDEIMDYLIEEVGSDVLSSLGYFVVITGDYSRTRYGLKYSKVLSKIKGVILTGYLPAEQYMWLIRNSTAVIGLTRLKHIMLRAFWEAAAFSKPVVAPDTPVTREIMGPLPYYYIPYVSGSLKKAIHTLQKDRDEAVSRGIMLSKRMRKLSEDSMRRLRALFKML